MKPFLEHLACMAVMVHMTFGCSWHHGIGSASACDNPNGLISCCGSIHSDSDEQVVCPELFEYGHTCHVHVDHDSGLSGVSGLDLFDSNRHGNSHLCCHDDGCVFLRLVEFQFIDIDFLTPYFGFVETLAILTPSSLNPLASYSEFFEVYTPKVRTHLLNCVQII